MKTHADIKAMIDSMIENGDWFEQNKDSVNNALSMAITLVLKDPNFIAIGPKMKNAVLSGIRTDDCLVVTKELADKLGHPLVDAAMAQAAYDLAWYWKEKDNENT